MCGGCGVDHGTFGRNGSRRASTSRGRPPGGERLHEAYQQITHELGKVIVGQQQVIEELLISLFARGHCLLVGVPGLAKTLMIRTLADALSLQFSRIQFTPDLMPSDITGTEVIQEDKRDGHARTFGSCPGRSSPT